MLVQGQTTGQGTDAEPTRLTRLGERLRTWLTASPANAGTALLVLILLVSLPFGGWRPAAPDVLAQADPGEPVTAAPYELVVERAIYGPELGGELRNEDYLDGQHVLLLLRIRNTSDETLTVLDLRSTIEVRGLPEPLSLAGTPQDPRTAWASAYDVHDSPIELAGLGPGMDYVIGLHQRTAAPDSALPETLTVQISSQTYRQMSIADEYRWADPVPVATVVVPLDPAGASDLEDRR